RYSPADSTTKAVTTGANCQWVTAGYQPNGGSMVTSSAGEPTAGRAAAGQRAPGMMVLSDHAAAKGARDMPKGTALVLGGAGADLTGADLIIGTSAGANVAAQVGSGLPLADLYARQADPERQARE